MIITEIEINKMQNNRECTQVPRLNQSRNLKSEDIRRRLEEDKTADRKRECSENL